MYRHDLFLNKEDDHRWARSDSCRRKASNHLVTGGSTRSLCQLQRFVRRHGALGSLVGLRRAL